MLSVQVITMKHTKTYKNLLEMLGWNKLNKQADDV